MLQEPNYIEFISSELELKPFQIERVLELVDEWSTVPFIARYRKERTGNLDEDQIRDIIDLKTKQENLYKAKHTAINGIEELGKMTPELMDNILKARTLKEVEAIYKPYKSKKKTKAMIAIEKWFQPIADYIKTNPNFLDIAQVKWSSELLEEYSEEEILEWTTHIIAAEITANADLRADLIETLNTHGCMVSKTKTAKSLEKLNEKDTAQIPKFDLYADFSWKIGYLKPYQVLALNRWENIWILNVKMEKTDKTFEWLLYHYARMLSVRTPFIETLQTWFKDWFDALFGSVENELRSDLSDIAEDDAIDTFRQNLGSLLMTRPEYGKQILAIDPWFRAGCKMALLDAGGNPTAFDKIFLHNKDSATQKLKNIITSWRVDVVVVGNWTGVNETVELIQSISDIDTYIVNESWASVYSASKTAQEEFPDLDSLDRGTVSIGRRYIDPLSELVKIPVGSIGVGMYQHDMPEKKLEEKLWYVVEDTVNEVGINVNTASSYVLAHISGIDKRSAKKIYNHRPYRSREHLQKQLSEKVYQQAAGFLRVPESSESLDNTDIHPEQYELAKYIVEHNITHIDQLKKNNPSQPSLKLGKGQEYFFSPWVEGEMSEGQRGVCVTQTTIEFIRDALGQMWVEKRVNSTHKKATKRWAIEIQVWDTVEWVIRNVVAFGAFVDIWMKNDGLVHVSQIADKFISDPKDEVEVGQSVRVKITGIDEKSGKIQLSMKEVI